MPVKLSEPEFDRGNVGQVGKVLPCNRRRVRPVQSFKQFAQFSTRDMSVMTNPHQVEIREIFEVYGYD